MRPIMKSDKDMVAYLEASLDEGDAALFTAALGDVARAKGMTEIASKTGLGRESLYRRFRQTAIRSSRPCLK